MNEKTYKELVKKHTPLEPKLKNGTIAFIVGGLMGMLGELLLQIYSYTLNISTSEATIFMIMTLILIASLLTALGIFDKLVNIAKAGLIVPITGFAHATVSATLEHRKEGLITGIGSNMFKLSGAVIIYGIFTAYIVGLIRFIIFGG